MELTEFGALVVNVIGCACVGFVAILMLIMIGAVLWMIAHMCGELGKTDLSRPICALTLENCIFMDDNAALCRDCQAYKDFIGKGSKDESDRQDGPQRGRISGSDRRRRSQEHAEGKTAKRRTASGSH